MGRRRCAVDHRKRIVAAAALVRRAGEILLVQQQAPWDREPSWALPGGVVEAGELLLDGLAREIREETGLTVTDPGSLLYVAQGEGPDGSLESSWVAFIFDVRDWTGEIRPDDPDGYILDARFLPIPDAVERLEALPWRFMREPIIACLRDGIGPGSLWCYREDGDGDQTLIECLPGSLGAV